MAPSSSVPTRPVTRSPGATGAVVPTPEGCHPVANCERVAVQLGKGTNCPTAGSLPVNTPRVPSSTTTPAISHTVTRTRPLKRPRAGPLVPIVGSAGRSGVGPGPPRAGSASSAASAASSVAASSVAASSSAWAPWNPCWKTRRK